MASCGNKAGGGPCSIVHTSRVSVFSFERVTASHIVVGICWLLPGLVICAEREWVTAGVVKVASGVRCWSCVVGWWGFARNRSSSATSSFTTVAVGDDESGAFACDVAQAVVPTSLVAVGVLATDVALGVRGLSTFVTVSVNGGVWGIGIGIVVFINLAVAGSKYSARNGRLETCNSFPSFWACSRKYMRNLMFSSHSVFKFESPGMLVWKPLVTVA